MTGGPLGAPKATVIVRFWARSRGPSHARPRTRSHYRTHVSTSLALPGLVDHTRQGVCCCRNAGSRVRLTVSCVDGPTHVSACGEQAFSWLCVRLGAVGRAAGRSAGNAAGPGSAGGRSAGCEVVLPLEVVVSWVFWYFP